jgi:hypothetical protein
MEARTLQRLINLTPTILFSPRRTTASFDTRLVRLGNVIQPRCIHCLAHEMAGVPNAPSLGDVMEEQNGELEIIQANAQVIIKLKYHGEIHCIMLSYSK